MAANPIGDEQKSLNGFTGSDSFDVKIKWTIKNFLDFPCKPGHSVSSVDFGGSTKYSGVKWKTFVIAYPQGTNVRKKNYMGVYLCIQVDPMNACLGISAFYEASIIGKEGKKIVSMESGRNQSDWHQGWGFDEFVNLKTLASLESEFLPDGHMTMQFLGKVFIRFDTDVCKRWNPESSEDANMTLVTMKKLFQNGSESDVIVKAGSQEFKCHKCVLSVRSEYFRAMFQSDMKESLEGVVDMSAAMDGKELKDLLEFLYLGKASNLAITCRTLLRVADMVGLPELKEQSEEALVELVKSDNAWDLLLLAHEQGAKKLQKRAHAVLQEDVD